MAAFKTNVDIINALQPTEVFEDNSLYTFVFKRDLFTRTEVLEFDASHLMPTIHNVRFYVMRDSKQEGNGFFFSELDFSYIERAASIDDVFKFLKTLIGSTAF